MSGSTSKTTDDFVIAERLTKRYGDYTALKDISFRLPRGTIMAIIGPNGSGKTTLAKLLLGLEAPTSGRVLIDGKAPGSLAGRIGYVPQRFVLDRSLPLTVNEFLHLTACRVPEHRASDTIGSALATVGLLALRERSLGVLSGGQLQRILVARALLHENEILVFDEPVTGIDVIGERAIYDVMVRINRERGTTIIIVTHELDAVLPFSTHVLCVNARTICFGSPERALQPDVLKALYGQHVGGHGQHH